MLPSILTYKTRLQDTSTQDRSTPPTLRGQTTFSCSRTVALDLAVLTLILTASHLEVLELAGGLDLMRLMGQHHVQKAQRKFFKSKMFLLDSSVIRNLYLSTHEGIKNLNNVI